MINIFSPLRLGDYQLKNRIVMAPMARSRANEGGVPSDLMAEYYTQRAEAGLIITEATGISRTSHGWTGSPGIYNTAQVEGWEKVTRGVHQAGGRIFVQLWHMGRAVLPAFVDGVQPISASPIPAQGEAPGPSGTPQPFAVPREMTFEDIAQVTDDFSNAALGAINAGFDGVEIHGANNFLLDTFLRDGANQRTDAYGGNAENRCRFMLEVVTKVAAAIGAKRVGVRISPTNGIYGISDGDPESTFVTLAKMLKPLGIAYLHVLEAKPGTEHPMSSDVPNVTPAIRNAYPGTMIVNAGYDYDSANIAVSQGTGDAVAFGVPFIANPDLVARLRDGVDLAMPNFDALYTPGAEGYTDYPTHQGA